MNDITTPPAAPPATPPAPAASATPPAATPPAPPPAAVDNGPWYTGADYGFDADTQRFFEGKNYPDVKTALSSLRHADQLARDRNVIAKPDPAKLGEWDGWEALGWKKELKDYAVQKPQLKDGQILDEEMFSSFTQDAHDLRIPLSAAQDLFNRQFTKAYERIGAQDAIAGNARRDLDTKLRGEWGDQYDVNVDRSKRAMRALGIGMDDAAELERMTGSPRMVKLFNTIGEKMGEDNLVTSGTGGGQDTAHPKTIEAELNRFENDPENVKIMQDQRDPRHQDVIEKRRQMIGRLDAARKRAG
ncbi:hypothetical protein ACWX0K_10955 [Nitrobacteraceae bacterium UC4446_H13]